jgi:hypothetical protein
MLRARYSCFFVQTWCHAPLLLCGWVYFRNVTRRPEFAQFRGWLVALAVMNAFFWAVFGAIEVYLLAILNFRLARPPESFWSIAHMVDWVDLASVVPETMFWFYLARQAWALREREEA